MSKEVGVSVQKQKQIDIAIDICRKIAEQERLHVAVIESVKGTVVTIVGGLLAGKPGILLGAMLLGALGSAVTYMMGSKFESVSEIIEKKLTAEQKAELSTRIRQLLGSINMIDLTSAVVQISSKDNLKQNVKREIVNFFTNELGKNLMY